MIRNNAIDPGKRVFAWLVILLGCFFFGYLAVRSPFFGILLIGAIGCLLVYFTAPHWMVWILLFAAFATMPAGVPAGKLVAGTIIYVFEVLLFLAIGFLILAQRNRTPISGLPGIYLMFVLITIITGILNGNERSWIILEARSLITLAAGFVLAELVVRHGLAAQAVKVMAALLWFSATMILANALLNVPLRLATGTVVSAAGDQIAGGAIRRYFTETQSPAFAVIVALIVVSVIVRVRSRDWLMLGVPGLVIIFFSFTRYSFFGLLAAVFAAGLVSARRTTLLRIVKITGISVAVVFLLTFLFQLSPVSLSNGWFGQQLQGYATRIFGGVTLFLEGGDTSYGARVAENANLWIAIREAPLFGHGFGYAYQPPFGPAGRFAATFGPYYAHNFYLWLLAKAGIVGLVGFAALVLTPIARALRTQSVEAKASAVVASIVLAVSVVAPAGESGTGALVLGIALGAAMAFSSGAITASTPESGFGVRTQVRPDKRIERVFSNSGASAEHTNVKDPSPHTEIPRHA